MNQTTRDALDVAAVAGTVGVWAEVLPLVAAPFAIIWTSIRIYEWARVRVFGRKPDAASK